uniref:Uncharacterized protein n=1 Tax=Myotis myotis TaxID=51298 RepID=A0A7J7WHV8_MYOMY|nr:hypothetical protein mMyoMyo1_012176 [Myotis myotis]
MTTGGVPAPNPNHPKEVKREEMAEPFPETHQRAYRQAPQERDPGSHHGASLHLWEHENDGHACRKDAPLSLCWLCMRGVGESDEAEKALKLMGGGHADGREVTATAVLAPGLGHPQASQPSQENATTTSRVAAVTPTNEEKVLLPPAQVRCASVIYPPLPPPHPRPSQEPLQLQFLLISEPPKPCPELTCHPTQFCHFSG